MLTNVLKSNSGPDKRFQEILNELVPGKEKFYTLSGRKAFSNEYRMLVQYNLNNPNSASLVGTAFDYLARIMIAKTVISNYKDFMDNLKATDGYQKMQRFIKNDPFIPMSKLQFVYDRGIRLFEMFIDDEKEIDSIVPVACFFAKLEHFERTGRISDYEKRVFFSKPSEDMIIELEGMCKVFQETFLIPEIVSPTSEVVYNPNFGVASLLVNGADADIIIDGVLYDFKTTKHSEYLWKDAAQLIAYFCLNKISLRFVEVGMPFSYVDLDIQKVGFYKARYGELECYNIGEVDKIEIARITEDLISHFREFPSSKVKMNPMLSWQLDDYGLYM
ncbi:hypothetical protein [Bacillus bombysepticus]|uniref:hypothetical protein n=1 Tax=Bacillus bombysepticus TaxID=658666 RepID=UPI003019B363